MVIAEKGVLVQIRHDLTRAVAAAVVAAVPVLCVASAAHADDGEALTITHSPDKFTVGQNGTFTVKFTPDTYSDPATVTVTDTVPSDLPVVSFDKGDFESCDSDSNEHTVTCRVRYDAQPSIRPHDDAASSFSITVKATKTGTFTDMASSYVDLGEGGHQGPNASNSVTVNSAATATPTPTVTSTPTPTPSTSPTATQSAVASPSPSRSSIVVRGTGSTRATPTLPNTGADESGRLVGLGVGLISIGAAAVAIARRRGPSQG